MYVKRGKSTIKQMAYAKRLLGGQGESKKQIALDSGYSPYVANSISSHIENKPGFHAAMTALATESNNLAMAAMHEFKARGFSDFTNKELVGALNAIGNAWAKFNAAQAPKEKDPLKGNRLRTVVLQQIENQNNTIAPDGSATASSDTPKEELVNDTKEVIDQSPGKVDDPMDF